MSKYDKLKKENAQNQERLKTQFNNISSGIKEMEADAVRAQAILSNPQEYLDEIDLKFQKITKLEKDDWAFLFFAVALQCARQYLLTNFKERLTDQESAKNTKGHNEEHSQRKRGEWYLPDPIEIKANPVPYDANRQIKSANGALKGAGKMGHRLVLGHDPILGWIFGTANIATSTLTTWNFDTYHVKTHKGSIGLGKQADFDFISVRADTIEMLEVAEDRFFHSNVQGYAVLAASLHKELVHLQSDINTKNSLPFPAVSIISPDLANAFANYGMDMCNIKTVGKQVFYSEAINLIIGILHGMYCFYIKYPQNGTSASEQAFWKHERDVLSELELSKVKTRNILKWSNVIASTSNLLVCTGVAVATKDVKAGAKYLDLGGYIVTLHRLISDTKFINQIKEEFVEREWQARIVGKEYTFMGDCENEEG